MINSFFNDRKASSGPLLTALTLMLVGFSPMTFGSDNCSKNFGKSKKEPALVDTMPELETKAMTELYTKKFKLNTELIKLFDKIDREIEYLKYLEEKASAITEIGEDPTADTLIITVDQAPIDSAKKPTEPVAQSEDTDEFADYHPLSTEELTAIQDKTQALQSKYDKLEKNLSQETSQQAQALIKKARKIKSESPTKKMLFREFARNHSIQNLDPKRTATLLVGNSFKKSDQAVLSEYLSLASELKKRGYTIVYDGDASTAADLAKAIGDRGLIVSSKHPSFDTYGAKVAVIENHYLRLTALGQGVVVTSGDSLSGLGQILLGNPEVTILNSGSWKQTLSSWTKRLSKSKTNLGIKYQDLSSYNTAKDLLASETGEAEEKMPRFKTAIKRPQDIQRKVSSSLSSFNYQQIVDAYQYVFQNFDGVTLLDQLPAGAVIFGSSKYPDIFLKQAYDISYHLGQRGIRITTGGAGGMMHVANDAAINAGALSVGIPISGRKTLAAEKRAFSESHTHTIPTFDYPVRINLLVHNNPLIGLVPGGMGTTRELAVVMMQLAAKADLNISLINSQYYQELHKWLTDLKDLPQVVLDRFSVADSAQDIDITLSDMALRNTIQLKRSVDKAEQQPEFDTDGLIIKELGRK